MLLDRVIDDTRLMQQTAVLAATSGAKVEIPSVGQAIAEFDEALNAEPQHLDADRQALLEVMGVARG